MGIYNTNEQWTTYRILDATILDVDVADAAAIGVGKLNHTAVLTDNNSGTITWICAAGSASAGAAGGITAGAGAGAGNAGGAVTLTGGAGITNGAGGNIQLTPGDSPSGTPGSVFVGADAAGHDVTFYGAVASYKVWFDANGDTNGAVYFGANTFGILVSLYGDVTGCGVFWDPTTDTNGTLSIGASGGSKGNDVIMYGATNGNYLQWDQSADDLLLVGIATQLGIAGTTDSSNTATGSIHTAGGLGVVKQAYFGDKMVVSQNTGAAAYYTGLFETLTITGACTGSTVGLRSIVTMGGSTYAVATMLGISCAARLVNTGDIPSGSFAGLLTSVDMGLCNYTAGTIWAYPLMLDITVMQTRAATPRGFISFQDYDYAGSKPVTYVFDFGGTLSGIASGSGLTTYNDTIKCALNNVARWIPLSTVEGTFTFNYRINLSGATLDVADDAVSLINLGTYDTAMSVAKMTDNTFGQTINLVSVANPDSDMWLAGLYVKVMNSTADQGNVSQVSVMVRQDIAKPVAAAYGIQSHLKFSGTGDCSSEVIAVSAQTYGTATVGTGYHWGVKSDLRAANTPSGAGHLSACFFGVGTVNVSCGLYIESLATTTMYSGIYLHAAGNMTNGIEVGACTNMTNFVKFNAVAGCVVANALVPAAAPDGGTMGADAALVCDVGGTPYYIPMYNTLHA